MKPVIITTLALSLLARVAGAETSDPVVVVQETRTPGGTKQRPSIQHVVLLKNVSASPVHRGAHARLPRSRRDRHLVAQHAPPRIDESDALPFRIHEGQRASRPPEVDQRPRPLGGAGACARGSGALS